MGFPNARAKIARIAFGVCTVYYVHFIPAAGAVCACSAGTAVVAAIVHDDLDVVGWLIVALANWAPRFDRDLLGSWRSRQFRCGGNALSLASRSNPADYWQRFGRRNGLVLCMRPRDKCRDNALAESFFSSLNKEFVKKRIHENRSFATDAIAKYLEASTKCWEVQRRLRFGQQPLR